MSQASELRAAFSASVGRAVVGQQQAVDGLLLTLLVRGHALLEGVPGTAKTLLARAAATAVGARFTRLQLTPDLLPSDILGTSVWRPDRGEFDFRPGPVFTDTLLADEINRAPAKTQAALLEAMEEHQVTSDGTTRQLGDHFLVVATQNPVEHEGTYPLPEALLDRFFFKVVVEPPPPPAEGAMLRRIEEGFDPHDLAAAGVEAVTDGTRLGAVREEIAAVRMSDEIVGYITAIVAATRHSPDLSLGASPRGAIALFRGAKVMAAIQGRDYVVPEDVKDICLPALRHRLVRTPEAELQGVDEAAAVERVVATVPVPR